MNKYRFTLCLAVCTIISLSGIAQKRLTEGTLTYDISINSGAGSPTAEALKGASNVVYIKGASSRNEMISGIGTQATLVDGKTKNVTVLKDYGAQKYMITMTPAEWKESNQKFDGVTFEYTNEKKQIQGYNCEKAVGTTTEGKKFDVYFTRELVPINMDFQYANKSLPGLAIQYDASLGDLLVTYTLSKIDFKPVPQAKFDVPTSGYRVLSYEESKKQK